MNKYITETITRRRVLRETDQYFEIDRYNVNFYFDEYLNHKDKSESYLLIIDQFDGIEDTARPVDKRTLYILKNNDDTYSQAWQALHDKNVLDHLMNYHNNTLIKEYMLKGV